MVSCQRCGATLDLAATSCPYCGTRTAHGYASEQQRLSQDYQLAQHAQAAQANERSRAEAEVKKQANIAVLTSVFGFVFCCAPASVAGLVLSLRAKSNARRYQLIAPASSTIGLIVGLFSTLWSLSWWIGFAVHSSGEEERRAELERRAAEQTLALSTACKLVEQRLESSGFGNERSIYSSTCNGRIAQRDNQAFLDGVRFRAEGKDVEASVCFTRASRWEISDVRADQRCAPAR